MEELIEPRMDLKATIKRLRILIKLYIVEGMKDVIEQIRSLYKFITETIQYPKEMLDVELQILKEKLKAEKELSDELIW